MKMFLRRIVAIMITVMMIVSAFVVETKDEVIVSKAAKRSVFVNTISKAAKKKAKTFPDVSGDLPKWRGVNVVDKAEFAWPWATTVAKPEHVKNTSATVFKKAEAIEIKETGYNFVRIALDARYFFTKESKVKLKYVGNKFYGNIKTANLTQYENLDKMIEWCITRGIHVCIDCHSTVGGLMIGGDEEASRKQLFTKGSKAQKIFIEFWNRMAKRYKDIDIRALSFNLYNEPPFFASEKEDVYVDLMNKAIDKIQSVTKDRLIFVDMMDYSTRGMEMIDKLHANNLVAAFHFYSGASSDVSIKELNMEECLEDISTRLPGYNSYAQEKGVRWMLQEYGCHVYVKEEQQEEYYKAILDYCKSANVPYALWAYNGGDFGVATWANKTNKYITPGAEYVKTSQGHRINKVLAKMTAEE